MVRTLGLWSATNWATSTIAPRHRGSEPAINQEPLPRRQSQLDAMVERIPAAVVAATAAGRSSTNCALHLDSDSRTDAIDRDLTPHMSGLTGRQATRSYRARGRG